ncbi:hypothetical protein HAX54_050575 [Datura stramonium]|uniref:Uncharacterized protein n=1 Tax=Datura stramonium TaxID=4076 RepID=A0ABS8SXG5_DATST|nr:hypothetical protein [Datura stramonium]
MPFKDPSKTLPQDPVPSFFLNTQLLTVDHFPIMHMISHPSIKPTTPPPSITTCRPPLQWPDVAQGMKEYLPTSSDDKRVEYFSDDSSSDFSQESETIYDTTTTRRQKKIATTKRRVKNTRDKNKNGRRSSSISTTTTTTTTTTSSDDELPPKVVGVQEDHTL